MDTSKSTLFKLNNIFFYSIINPTIRDKIGFRSISGLSRDRGWYVWLYQSTGVHDLFTLSWENENSAKYITKYYPSPDEPIFPMYSDQERILRSQYLFERGVPKQDIRDNEMADFFITGQLDILWEDHLIWLHLITVENDSENEKLKVPRLQLSHNLYTHLIRAICFFTKTAPSLALTRKINIPQQLGDSVSPLLETEPTTARQFTCVLLPDVLDKCNEIAGLCASIGVSQVNYDMKSLGGELWEPLYVENHNKTLPEFSPLLDKMWWELPLQAMDILPEEKYTI